jgi:hypothetical protein
MYITIMAQREKGERAQAFEYDMECLHAWLKHSNFNGTITTGDPLRFDDARDAFLRLAYLVAKDYPDSADWKDARPQLVGLAYSALGAIGINPELEETSEDF